MSRALVTVAQMEIMLGLDPGGGGPQLDDLVESASAVCEGEAGRNLLNRGYSGDLYTGDGSPVLMLRNWPITSVVSVSVGGAAQTVGDDPDTYDVQVRPTHLIRGSGWGTAVNGISVTYCGGYLAGTVDADGIDHDQELRELRRAAALIVKDWWQKDKSQRPEVQSLSGGGRGMTFVVDPPIPALAARILARFKRPGIA